MSTVTLGCTFPAGIKLNVNSGRDTIEITTRADPAPGVGNMNVARGPATASGIDAALWDAWISQNSTNQLYTSGTVYEISRP